VVNVTISLINPTAPLEKRLKILTSHLQQSGEYYKAAILPCTSQPGNILKWPFSKNQGGLSVFGTALTDSIKASNLTSAEKLQLQQNVAKTIKAINTYIEDLKAILANKNYIFRSFRMGKICMRKNLSMTWPLILHLNRYTKRHWQIKKCTIKK